MTTPLVSVLLYNYNYGRYLRQCFESIHRQTYDNIEVVFADNCSTDDSWKTAQGYSAEHPGRVTLIRQATNRGAGWNLQSCWHPARGKYAVVLCSDDAMESEFITRCVEALEKHPTAGYAMAHRSIIDEQGKRTEEPSFYDRSCVIPGHEQAAVYMMAALNPCVSQIVYSRQLHHGCNVDFKTGDLGCRWFGQRMIDFNICRCYDMVYIKEPLLLHRVHADSDSVVIAENLIELIGQYVMIHQFAETAAGSGMTKAAARLPEAIAKLARNCLRYADRSAKAGNMTTAKRLAHLAMALDSTSVDVVPDYTAIPATGSKEFIQVTDRKESYEPPPGSREI